MNDNVPADPNSSNTFLAILRSTKTKEIHITQAEYETIRQIRLMLSARRHCQVLLGYRDGKLYLSEVNLVTSFEVAALGEPLKKPLDNGKEKTGI